MLHVPLQGSTRMRNHNWSLHVVFTQNLARSVASSAFSYKNPTTKANVSIHASLFHSTKNKKLFVTNLPSLGYASPQDFPTYYFTSCVSGQLLSYIRHTKRLKDDWENLKQIFSTTMTVKKLQLKEELSNARQKDQSVADYMARIKEICDSLASINVTIEEDEMVQICLGGLASKFRAF